MNTIHCIFSDTCLKLASVSHSAEPEAVHLIITETTFELDFLLGNSVHEMIIIILV